jgi:1,4-dihydroxy-2-naphthoate octaprenyltransferase
LQSTDIRSRFIFDRDTILHLRIPFSFFLLPVFCFGISQASSISLTNTVIVFIALHLFIYPGSNVYNSFMDEDTGSIGGLKNPPPVTRKLYNASIVCDTIGLALCAIAGWRYVLLMVVYVAFSKAYSWHGIRLKKYAYTSWLVIAIFQGGYTFMLAKMTAENDMHLSWFTTQNILAMTIASLLIGGSYPLTQIYQHKEDSSRGDRTISYRMGITGTFVFTLVMFVAAATLLFYYFSTYASYNHFLIFSACLAPVMIYFLYWFSITSKNPANADFRHAMLMNKVSAICMVVCFTILLIIGHAPVV